MTVKSFLSKFILPIATLVIGVALGSSITLYGINKYWIYYMGLLPVKYIIWESQEAYVPYFEGKTEAAQYALEHNVRVLEYFSKVKEVDSWGASTDLALTYMRLGKLAELKGDKQGADRYFSQGLEQFNKTMKNKCSSVKLRSLIDKFDSKRPEKTFPTFGSIFENKPAPPNTQIDRTQ
jgi:hypothetical protein